jgi:enoyl-CoA hydratase
MSDFITIMPSANGIVTVRLNRAAQRNSLTPDVISALAMFAQEHGSQPGLRAVVLAGASEFFSAGFELTALPPQGPQDADGMLALSAGVSAGGDMCRAWERIEVPTLAAIEGFCVGGALALALACDFRIASASATFRLPEVPIGMHMGWGALPRLTALVGPARAKRLAWLGQPLPAADAAAWGLVDEVTAPGQAEAAVLALAAQLAALPALPVRTVKSAVNAAVAAASVHSEAADTAAWLACWATSGTVSAPLRK